MTPERIAGADAASSLRSVRALRSLRAICWALAVVSVVAVGAFFVATVCRRIPYWGEAEVLFEASRIRRGWPLFVDPMVGATEAGPPASRWYVTYPPILSGLTALLPAASAQLLGRMLAAATWFGTLAALAASATPGCRPRATYAATLVAGVWLLANFATVGRPDALACALAASGLVRGMRRGALDPLAVALLVVAACTKPTVLGIPAGAIVTDAVTRRSVRPVAWAGTVAGLVALAFAAAGAGQVWAHVVASNAQPLSLAVWWDQVPGRLPLFGPIVAVAALASFRERRRPGIALGLGALAASAAWTLVALSKTGSAANYWMEPCVAAVAVLARAAPTDGGGSDSLVRVLATLAHAAALATASVRGAYEHARTYRAEGDALAAVRAHCGDGPIASDTQGVELALDGRILVPTYQFAWLVGAGRLPEEPWRADLGEPAIRCYVVQAGSLAPAPSMAGFVARTFSEVTFIGPFEVRRKPPVGDR